MQPHEITKEFEKALCEYTGAKYAVAVNSCTMALMLAVKWYVDKAPKAMPGYDPNSSESEKVWERHFQELRVSRPFIEIPRFTYNSVPMSIIHAGGKPAFRDEDWSGSYQLKPYLIWDSARRFTSGMYKARQFQCVSFHTSKILADTQGGAILHDNGEADVWFRKARFDGRTEGVEPKDDDFILGYHCYMSPDVAARLLWKLSVLPKHNADLPNSDYPDLSKQAIFR